VWKLHADNAMEPVKVWLGITDHAYTQVNAVIKGELKDGEALIIRSVTGRHSPRIGKSPIDPAGR
jgi:hypothetical protein